MILTRSNESHVTATRNKSKEHHVTIKIVYATRTYKHQITFSQNYNVNINLAISFVRGLEL